MATWCEVCSRDEDCPYMEQLEELFLQEELDAELKATVMEGRA